MELHPEILKKNGKNQFVVLPYEEFIAMRDRLEEADDLRSLRRAKRKESKSPATPLADVKRRFGLKK
jgi:PHD/YefM family antitoxin component YafN of YafNO toxin-antitoxin module